MSPSPYELCTDPAATARLHPRLRAYFAAIPPGHVGRGDGVFAVVGTPRRWLWPFLALFARDDVMFPVWERDVPFTVENRPARVGRGAGNGREGGATESGHIAVRAHRAFRFAAGTRMMVDAITAEPAPSDDHAVGHVLTDHLGRRGRVSAALRVEVDADGPEAGALRLVSTRVSFRALGREWGLPAALAPRVRLTERFDDEADRQRVSLVLSAPIIGTIYRYEGAFTYSVVRDERTS